MIPMKSLHFIKLSFCVLYERDNLVSDNSKINGPRVPVFVSKWIDYSNKYGFGYQLSDGTSGVFFNNSSQISIDGSKT